MHALRGWHYPRLVAHRGGGILAPENTRAGLEAARAYGFRAVEFDVMLTGEGTPVLMHDEVLGRTVRASGRIADYTYEALRHLDAGSWFSHKFAGEPVPTLAEALAWLDRHGIWANIEIKPASGAESETGHIVASMVDAWVRKGTTGDKAGKRRCVPPPLLSSFSPEALGAAQAAAPSIARAFLVKRIPLNWAQRLETFACAALHCDHRYIDGHTIGAVKEAGYGLMVYTVNNLRRARYLLAQGVDAICTDRLDMFATFNAEADL